MESSLGSEIGDDQVLEASKRLARRRLAAPNQALVEMRRKFAARLAASLAEDFFGPGAGPRG